MMKSNQKGSRNRCACVLIPLAGLTAVCVSLTWPAASASVAQEGKGPDDPKGRAQEMAFRAAAKSATAGFQASLEMSENADFLLTPALLVQEALSEDQAVAVRFDAIIELNAALCRTYVVLFARYWVSADAYRAAVVWGEPHAGSLNFPIYPPTLQVASDANSFTISHQLVHTYDVAFPKPLGPRGPFKHRFNSYALSDIRFAEQEALELHMALRDTQCADSGGEASLRRRDIFLAERPIMVGFSGAGPAITIAGETRRYPELEIMHPQGGRQYAVEYQVRKIAGRTLPLPVQVGVYSGDQRRILRSAHLSDYVECNAASAGIEEEANRFSQFDPDEIQCRELLLEYWMKDPREILPRDVDRLRRLRADFAGRGVAGGTVGEKLKHVDMLLELDWMLDDAVGLERDFREYLFVLSSSRLGRMILFGGQNVIETTIRWRWLTPADTLLGLWLHAATAQNDIDSILDFADAGLATRRFWTNAKLMDKMLADSCLSTDQRFVAQALRSIALSGLCGMVEKPDHVTTELGIAQARWAASRTTATTLAAELRTSLTAAQQLFARLGRSTSEQRALKSKLDKIEQNLRNQETPSDVPTSEFIGSITE